MLLNRWRITNFKAFSINLNAQPVNGMTPLDLNMSVHVRLLDALEYYMTP